MENIEWLNSWDHQRKRIVGINGVYPCLNAGERAGGGTDGVCYALGGNGARPSHLGNVYSADGEGVTAYSIGAMNSEGMLSDNPKSGIHEATIARAVDVSGGNPACWQGGILVLIKRKEKNDN